MSSSIVTTESLKALLEKEEIRPHVVGRALVVLFKRQTDTERSANTTNTNNNMGFTSADAHSGCITAKYYIKHGKLEEWQVDRWIKPDRKGNPRIVKYWKQLNEAASERMTAMQN